MTKNSASVPQLIRISFKDDVNVIRLLDASISTTELEFLNNLWGLGTEQE
jgi:hypothetical protein